MVTSLLKKTCDFIGNKLTISTYRLSETDFSRESPLSFPIVVSSILHLFKESVEFNISQILPSLGKRIVTGAAFSKAREKIKIEFFKDLNSLQLGTIKSLKVKLWKGYQLLAFDGTTLIVPASKQNKDFFGIHSKSDTGRINCMVRCLFCVDVLSDYIYGHVLANISVGEGTLFKQMLPQITTIHKSIFLLDRNFGNFSAVSLFTDLNQLCCIRMSIEVSTFAKRVMADSRSDFETIWNPTAREKQSARANSLSTNPLKVRVSKVILDSGEIELLVSNIFDYENITQEYMKELYFKRWQIEEVIKK